MRKFAASLIIVFATLVLIPNTPASATSWDPHVRVQGAITCGTGSIVGVWYYTSWGEQGWSSYYNQPSAFGTANYGFDLYRVPTGTKNWLDITFGCGGTPARWGHSQAFRFGIARPWWGIQVNKSFYMN